MAVKVFQEKRSLKDEEIINIYKTKTLGKEGFLKIEC